MIEKMVNKERVLCEINQHSNLGLVSTDVVGITDVTTVYKNLCAVSKSIRDMAIEKAYMVTVIKKIEKIKQDVFTKGKTLYSVVEITDMVAKN